ncbi:MAG: ABC transporter substrate-binding protein [Clostridiales Family XIII bacterium]|jgi:ABC-type branched-subunit amino acid transport system substrate-binding protein|nr:ABC transporter substrate-binding protein [Clostridiales Family XIII bacterium]
MKRRLAILFLTITLCALLALPSCTPAGQSGASSSASGASGSAAASSVGSSSPEAAAAVAYGSEPGYVQGVQEHDIIVANSAATTGLYAPVGAPFNAGIRAYFDKVNAADGIDGKRIRFQHIDDEFDADKSAAALKEFVEDRQVFAIVGQFGTPVVTATAETLKQYGIPAVYFASGTGRLYTEEAKDNATGYNLFPVQPLYHTEGGLMAAYASARFGAKKIAILYTNDDFGMDLELGVVEEIERIEGLEYVEKQIATGTTDVAQAVLEIKDADPDVIILASMQLTLPAIVSGLVAQELHKPCLTSYVNASTATSKTLEPLIRDKFEIYASGWIDYTSEQTAPAYAEYLEWIAKETPTGEDYSENTYAMAGWVAAHTFTEGLRRLEGREVTWESYMAALTEAPILGPFGSVVDFAGGRRVGTQAMSLSRIVPVSEAFPKGWELVEPLRSAESLLGVA